MLLAEHHVMRALMHSCGGVTVMGTGTAIVRVPSWFVIRGREVRYQLTCIGEHAPVYVDSELEAGCFRIGGGRAGVKVSWQLTAVETEVSNEHTSADEGAPDPALSPRLREACEVMMTGASNKEIALRLGISQHTANQYVKMLLHAYGVGRRAELIACLLARCSCGRHRSEHSELKRAS
jgi:DNA-binding CsgD family transcriptional regulator